MNSSENSSEKIDLEKVIGSALEKKIMPELKEIKTKLKEHDEKFEMIIEAVADTKVDVTALQEDINNVSYTIERIETRLNSVIHSQDDIFIKTKQLNRRVLRLESKKV